MSIYEDLFNYDEWNDSVEMNELEGKTIKDIARTDDAIYFYMTDGTLYKMYHVQSCCESVYIEDIDGELRDLIGDPIHLASAESSGKNTTYGHETWTFYKISTIRGHVTIRWYGSSNGYYSEEVSLVRGRPLKEGSL